MLPDGEVTFLFTDLEASTRLLQRLGDDYPAILGKTRELIRAAVAAEGGSEVDCYGDELFIAFADPGSAVRAALAGQRAFAAHHWPETVRVRMGLHTGCPARDGSTYVGLDVHRAARISAAAHGGQVLVSEPTRQLLDLETRDLGEYALPGLENAERLHQLVVEDLPSEFPPPRQARPLHEERLRVTLAEDSVLIREGIARLLEDAGMEVVAQAGTAEELLEHVEASPPDVAIVDIRMPPTHTDEGLRAAQRIRQESPDVGVLVLSQYVEPAYAIELMSAGAQGVGYLLKDRVADVDEFAAAVRRVAAGGSALDPELVSELMARPRRDDPLAELDQSEREVLELMAEGHSDEAIAERLFVPIKTVEAAVSSIFEKLALYERPESQRRVLAVLTYLDA